MAYKSVNVEITQEHFDRSIKGSPKEAVKELIWNACDADAKNIEVSFDYDGIAGAESVGVLRKHILIKALVVGFTMESSGKAVIRVWQQEIF